MERGGEQWSFCHTKVEGGGTKDFGVVLTRELEVSAQNVSAL